MYHLIKKQRHQLEEGNSAYQPISHIRAITLIWETNKKKPEKETKALVDHNLQIAPRKKIGRITRKQ